MSCDFGIHEGMRDMGGVKCPFCDDQISEIAERDDFCCFGRKLIKDKGKLVSKNCGKVDSYDIIDEYIDFYENKCKMMRKSVYHRKYHVRNIVNNMSINGNKISVQNGLKIFRIFKEIEKVLPQVNRNRKRMINKNFILKQLFKMMKLPCDNITVTKSKRTLAFYEQYCNDVMSLKSNEIKMIINR